jgi:hypothetical protein
MNESMQTFQLFHDRQAAEQLGQLLQEHHIPFEIVKLKRYFDPSFAFNKFEPDVQLQLRPSDFTTARQIIATYYKTVLDQVDRNYYLWRFTDRELLEIMRKPDEWGIYDQVLAQRILHERGIEVGSAHESISAERLLALKQPEKLEHYWIVLGYVLALTGGFFGMLMGWLFRNLKKTLPNGEQVYVYGEKDRLHGSRMMVIGGIAFSIFMIISIGRTL